jgi:hypothetical protein
VGCGESCSDTARYGTDPGSPFGGSAGNS